MTTHDLAQARHHSGDAIGRQADRIREIRTAGWVGILSTLAGVVPF
ncbi:hypothetical protein [Streptomyces syringium]